MVILGGVCFALLLFLSAQTRVFPYLFGVSPMLALAVGIFERVPPTKFAWRRRTFRLGLATVCLAGILTASALLFVAIDADFLRLFCDPVSGRSGDVVLDENDSCNYDYGAMALYFANFFAYAVAPFIAYAFLLSAVRIVRRKLVNIP